MLSDIMLPDQTANSVTASERYLTKLCRDSFLSLWSYPNVYRDEGKTSESAHGKEICDLLVVFGDHLLIFSDKYCQFPDTGDLKTDWNRWYKKAVLKSAQQLWGAERWLRENPNRVFLDRGCTQKLPIMLPDPANLRVHRIAVAHGAASRCRQELGGSGSLIVHVPPIIQGNKRVSEEGEKPFIIGTIDPSKGYVHVLDDTSLNIVLGILDTVADFVAFLDKKEEFFTQHGIMAAGEEDLLGFYLRNVNSEGEHDFVVPNDISFVAVDEGFWHKYLISPERHAMQQANRISYGWDSLIEKFSHHIITNTQHYTTHPNDVSSNERIIRFMAAETRTQRRFLSNKLYELMRNTPITHKAASVCVPSEPRKPYYVFLLFPQNGSESYEEYRAARRMLLEAYWT